ncbi:pyruvate carboxylase subunit B [Mammaliicoccus sciuri]|uniref:Oxaloacetate decarboxylase, alpha subunit n=1 Tax=Sporosarcina newyorkensis TaxID=759851 RepID=A0A1T4XZ30_9BACL|nr:pyruvate carboxylase subunit B [Sporosarcina newyorkensis]SKA94814.1 oxaloacetate decarboxylase, alpha subunit [Sporosarcina newyorkensis]
MKEIKIVDTTIRDAHQSLWATRMTTPMMIPMLEKLKNAEYDTVDLMAMVHFDACVRYLREDPWERIRIVSKALQGGPRVGGWIRSGLFGFDVAPDDIRELFIEKMVDNGINRIAAFDGLLDVDNLAKPLIHAKKLGAYTVAALVFCDSPLHTDKLYVSKTIELLEKVKVDAVMIKDAGGLLTPERVRTLVPALKQILGDIPLELHSHCSTGLAPVVYLEGVKHGADVIHTAVSALANDISNPSIQTIAKNLRDLNYQVNVNDQLIHEIDHYFREVAAQEGFPLGKPKEYDSFHYKHQIPGGMLTNMYYQLEQAGIRDRQEEVLEEISIIREELAYPIMVTPFSQFVGTQAVLNVLHGERYKFVPNEIKKYAQGYYGQLMAPIDENLLDKIIGNETSLLAEETKPAKRILPELRRQFPNMTDEEMLLRYIVKGNHVDEMKKAGPISQEPYEVTPKNAPTITNILAQITKSKEMRYFHIKSDTIKLEIGK